MTRKHPPGSTYRAGTGTQRVAGTPVGIGIHCRAPHQPASASVSQLQPRGVSVLQGVFCGDCLYMRYGENVEEAARNSQWRCPSCRDPLLCNCSRCRGLRGWGPTGTLFRRAITQGALPPFARATGPLYPHMHPARRAAYSTLLNGFFYLKVPALLELLTKA